MNPLIDNLVQRAHSKQTSGRGELHVRDLLECPAILGLRLVISRKRCNEEQNGLRGTFKINDSSQSKAHIVMDDGSEHPDFHSLTKTYLGRKRSNRSNYGRTIKIVFGEKKMKLWTLIRMVGACIQSAMREVLARVGGAPSVPLIPLIMSAMMCCACHASVPMLLWA